MIVKRIILLIGIVCGSMCAMNASQKPDPVKVSILGDSYSTFEGYLSPDTNNVWYRNARMPLNDVSEVGQTWWWMLISDNGMALERNNSFSGATVCNTGYNGADFSDRSFVNRATNLGNPDVILVFGGTNDSWAGAPLGDDYTLRDPQSLYSFRPAFACMLERLKATYPDAMIFNITNTELSDGITSSMAEICEAYDVPNVVLSYIDKQKGHPSVSGMKAISSQVWQTIAPYLLARGNR